MTLAFQAPNSLHREHAALLVAYGQAQARCSRLLSAQAQRIQCLEAEVFKLRAAVIQRDTALAWAREDRAALEGAIPGLPRRVALARRVAQLMERVQNLMRERLAWQDRAAQARAHPLDSAAEPTVPAAVIAAATLREKSVLCVGEDAMALMLTRKVVEMAGGRYLGHCGGESTNGDTLEASLVAADLVICQTGCVSHGAYWRVKDHCTRTGKQCVLVDKPEALTALGLARESAESPR
ncbi:DUF2325 domain-containing protein [Achromobacter xylosoxidans]|jgi:hypothetical protein|uniref:DUF2325 domain-containing protein n=1 Tax=Alcaligenes xylosoxydans xylosoxydans TaxID=85698 RepID=UPI00064DBDF7|nr:DUF2325 domain-containing protein [Achromobacter xylosoxidans]KMJ91205.1 hypothetical protein ACH58_00180 [Achromobacter xylosoxidans]MBK1979962.1 DUF2325 domain-containing protein [Achromobacter xylosoxidans]MCZ8383941.1 DUF2325 domain-containing protein [Achromobacter xylosoxidans]OMG78709.1 hypothetical protein BI147_11910 [Achromobacter xylosoxidans]PNM88632.1 DUF2325 domain-containing protein [Achromobacter xylosoxidans]